MAQDVDEAVHAVVLPPAVHDRAGERGLTRRDTHGGKMPPLSDGHRGELAGGDPYRRWTAPMRGLAALADDPVAGTAVRRAIGAALNDT